MQKSVIFWDNDGVLVDTEILYYRATRNTLRSVGIDLTEDQFRRFFLKEARGAWHLAAEKGISAQAIDSLREERNRLYHRLLQEENITNPEVEPVLQALTDRRIRMAVVTSSKRIHFETIHSRTGLIKYFELVITAEEVKETKPSPEPYLLALKKVGCEPGECVVIEDSERGLMAAKAAGLECWVYPTKLTGSGDFQQADKVIDHLEKVIEFLY